MKKDKRLLFDSDGNPRYIRIYDKPDTFDRYTIIFSRLRNSYFHYIGLSINPFHPQGYFQHGESNYPIDYPKYSHLGKKIKFDNLPADVKKAVLVEYKSIWNVE